MRGNYEFIVEHLRLDEKDVDEIAKLVPGPRTVLDVGCGRGGFLRLAGRLRGTKGVGLDVDGEAVKYCRVSGLKVYRRRGEKTGFRGNSFEAVRAKEVLEHLGSPEEMVLEVRRVLKPGGIFIVHVPTQYSVWYPLTNFWDDYTHVRPFTKRALERLMAVGGFRLLRLEGYTVGRSWREDILGRWMGRVFPFAWRAVGRVDKSEAAARARGSRGSEVSG